MIWRLVWLAAALWACAAQAQEFRTPTGRPASPELAALLATPVGADPAGEMHWSTALDLLGRPDDALRLRTALLDQWLRQAGGEAQVPAQPIEAWLASAGGYRGAALGPPAVVQARWQAAWVRQQRVQLETAAVPVPPDLDYQRDRLETPAPGVWLHRDAQGRLLGAWAWMRVGPTGAIAVPAMGFALAAGDDAFSCRPPRGEAAQLATPGNAVGMLCQHDRPAAAEGLAQRLAKAQSGNTWRMVAGPLETAEQQHRLADTLAAPQRAAAQAWVDQTRRSAIGRAEAIRQAEQKVQRDKDAREARKRRIIFAAALLVATAAYIAVARWLGPVSASVALWIGGMLWLAPTGVAVLRAASGSGGWSALATLIVGPMLIVLPTVVAMAALVLYRFVVRFYEEAEYRNYVVWSIAGVLATMALNLVMQLLT